MKGFRQVSELRIQYLCEYRLYLRLRFGAPNSQAQRVGTHLHGTDRASAEQHFIEYEKIFVVVAILTIIAGILWVMEGLL